MINEIVEIKEVNNGWVITKNRERLGAEVFVCTDRAQLGYLVSHLFMEKMQQGEHVQPSF